VTDYHGAEEALIDEWVRLKLTNHTAFNVLFTGLTGRVFNRYAPSGTTYPYIIFQAQTPPDVVRGVGDAEVMVDTIYIVKAVAQADSFAPLANVAAAIRTAMVYPNGDSLTGGSIFTSRYEKQFSMVEPEATKQYRHLGGEFRIQAQAS
jgi:hypothetical protein